MKKIIIAAGGTGGHINAALSLGEFFQNNYSVHFISGQRYLDYKLFKGTNAKHLAGKPLRSKNPITLLKNIIINTYIFFYLLFSYLADRPRFIIGTGGYICGPALITGWVLRIPIYIVEQNAVAGLTNRILSKFARTTFLNFKNTQKIDLSRSKVVGNPIRNEISFSENIPGEKINLLVFGGSLGAQQLNEMVKDLVDIENIAIKHQVGAGKNFNFEHENYEQVEYIDDMNEAYRWANIILARSGASTVSELELVKKPCLLIPYPAATDNHQYFNAMELKKLEVFRVEIFDPRSENLSSQVKESIREIIREQDFKPHKNHEPQDVSKLIAGHIEENL